MTDKGRQQMVDMGRFVNDRYVKDKKFLQEVYDPTEIYVQSTETNRTVQSALSHLVGQYGYDKLDESIQKGERFIT